MSTSKVFEPFSIGNVQLQHRIAMAPLTRLRADADNIQLPISIEYYSQRAVVPGTLIISEASAISHRTSSSFPHAPGIWNDEHIQRWKEVTDAVHARGSYIVCQIVALGRAGFGDALRAKG